MNNTQLSNRHKAVLNALKNEHLTSFQILNKVNSISLILVVYDTLEELKNMGILSSYVKEEITYHYIDS